MRETSARNNATAILIGHPPPEVLIKITGHRLPPLESQRSPIKARPRTLVPDLVQEQALVVVRQRLQLHACDLVGRAESPLRNPRFQPGAHGRGLTG